MLDTCMCVLCSLLVIDMNWIAARIPTNWQAWQDIELKPGANVCSSSMAKVVGCSALSCWELEQATWFLVAGSKRIPGSRHTPTSATKESSSHKVSCVWKTPTFSALNNAKGTLFIDLTHHAAMTKAHFVYLVVCCSDLQQTDNCKSNHIHQPINKQDPSHSQHLYVWSDFLKIQVVTRNFENY